VDFWGGFDITKVIISKNGRYEVNIGERTDGTPNPL